MEEKENLQSFLAENAIKAENVKSVMSQRFVDKDRKPIEWEFRVLTNDESDAILQTCKKKDFIPGTRDYKTVTDHERFAAELACACTVHPNLDSAVLQSSYGAVGAVDVLKKMLTPGEYADLVYTVQEVNGFKLGMADKIKKAKN